jgi:hypothetical protein
LGRVDDTPQDTVETPASSPRPTGRFAVMSNPVRHLEWPGMAAPARPPAPKASTKPAKASTNPTAVKSPQANVRELVPSRSSHRVDTPPPFVTSEVISAFHLQEVQLPTALEEVTRGAARGGKAAIIASLFALASVVGAGVWWSSPGADVTPPQSVTSSALQPAHARQLPGVPQPVHGGHGDTTNAAAARGNEGEAASSPGMTSSGSVAGAAAAESVVAGAAGAESASAELASAESASAELASAESASARSRSAARKSASNKSADAKAPRTTSKSATASDVQAVSSPSGASSLKPTIVESANNAADAQRELPASEAASASARASAVPRVYRNQ